MQDRKKKTRAEGEQDAKWSAVSLAWQLGFTIAIPIVVLALGGRFLDKRLDTSPWLLLAGIFLSLIITTLLIYLKVAKILAAMDGKGTRLRQSASAFAGRSRGYGRRRTAGEEADDDHDDDRKRSNQVNQS